MPTEAQFRRMVSEASDQSARSALYRARRDGDLKIDDEIPLAPIPTTATVARHVKVSRDDHGRTTAKTFEPVKVETSSPNGAPRLSQADQYSFDRMKESFAKLPDDQRHSAMDALVKAALPRLIHE